jgi:hypothetical protein
VGASITKLTKWRHMERLLCPETIASHDEKVAVIIVMPVSRGTPIGLSMAGD